MLRLRSSFAALFVLYLLGRPETGAAQGAPPAAVAATPAQAQLWDAAVAGDTTALAEALSAGADVNALDTRRSRNGRRALNWAALNNHPDALRFLLAHGADLEGTNLTGFTALHHAAEAGSLEAAQALLDAGADVNHMNVNGDRPVETARAQEHMDVAMLLQGAERRGPNRP